MTLKEQLVAANPDLEMLISQHGPIILQDDSDGAGVYIAEWNTAISIPNGFSVGK